MGSRAVGEERLLRILFCNPRTRLPESEAGDRLVDTNCVSILAEASRSALRRVALLVPHDREWFHLVFRVAALELGGAIGAASHDPINIGYAERGACAECMQNVSFNLQMSGRL